MTPEMIEQIALANGFKLKRQPDESMALNPYVFEFARALLASDAADTPPVPAQRSLLGVVHQFMDVDGRWQDCPKNNSYFHAISDYATRKLFIYTEEQETSLMSGSVKMPTNADEAEMMVKLGMLWLEQNAPERLKAQ